MDDIKNKYNPTRDVYTIVNEQANEHQLRLLNDTERQKLDQLTQRLQADYAHDVKDKPTLVRFLKARKWDVDKAENMFRHRMKWINDYQPHKITENDVRECCEAGKAFFYGRDKLGRPILIIRAARHRKGDNLDLFFKYFVYLSELGQMMAPYPPHNQYLIVYDRAASNRKNLDPKGALKMVSLGDYYPEMIGTACVTHPNLLYQFLFNASRAFMDPVTIGKIKLFSTKRREMFAQWLDMVGDRSQVLPDMGGSASQSALQHYPPSVPEKYVFRYYVTLGSESELDVLAEEAEEEGALASEEGSGDVPVDEDSVEGDQQQEVKALGDGVDDLDLD